MKLQMENSKVWNPAAWGRRLKDGATLFWMAGQAPGNVSAIFGEILWR